MPRSLFHGSGLESTRKNLIERRIRNANAIKNAHAHAKIARTRATISAKR